jgi:uncharacterized protein YcgI (DUF1989 family)
VEKVYERTLAPKSGLALQVRLGQFLRITDLEGKKVVDMVVFNSDDLREKLSTAYSRTRYIPDTPQPYYPRDNVQEGDWLMSTLCRPMFTIVKETPRPKGVHSTHVRMCNRFFYEVFGTGAKDGCFEILSAAGAPYGILPQDLPDSFDLFMNYPHDCSKGHFAMREPVSKAGDYVEFRAEMNCLVVLSNCPDTLSGCNGGEGTPILVEVYEDKSFKPESILPPGEWLKRELGKRRGKQVSALRND